MAMKPLLFFILIYAAIRDHRLERELDDEVWADLVDQGYANPDGTMNNAALRANAVSLEEVIRAYADTPSMVD